MSYYIRLFSAIIKSTGVIVYLLLLILLLMNRKSKKGVFSYVIFYISGLLLWEVGSFIITITKNIELASICYRVINGLSSLPIVFLYPLVRHLLEMKNKGKIPELVGFGFIFCGFLLSGLGIGVDGYQMGAGGYYIPIFNSYTYIFSAIGFVYWVFSVVWAVDKLKNRYGELQRYRTKFILFGSVLVFIGEMSNLTPVRNIPLDHVLIMINGIIIVYGFLKSSIVDYRPVFKKTVLYLTIYFAGIFSLHLFSNFFNDSSSHNLWILKSFTIFFGLATFILMAVVIKHSMFKMRMGGVSVHSVKKYRRIIEDLSSRLIHISDIASLSDELVNSVKNALNLKECRIFIKNHEVRGYEEVTGGVDECKKQFIIGYEDPFVKELKLRGEVLYPDELMGIGDLTENSLKEHPLLTEKHVEVLVPIEYQSELMGFLCLGPKNNTGIITDEEISFCSVLANISSTALSNILNYMEFNQLSREQKLLRYISERVISSFDLDKIMDSICSLLFNFMKLDYCAVVILEDGGGMNIWSRGIPSSMVLRLENYFMEKINIYSGKSSSNVIELPETNYTFDSSMDSIENLLKSSYTIVLSQEDNIVGLVILSGNLKFDEISRKIDFMRMIRSIITQGVLLHMSLQSLQRLNRYKENLLKNLDSMGELLITFDRRGVIFDVNDSVTKILGYEENELIDSRLDNFLAAESEKLWKDITDALKHGISTSNMELVFRTKAGNKKHILFSCSVLNPDITGSPVYMATGRDITYLKEKERIIEESENKYRTLFEELHDGIFVCNERDEIVDINPAGIEILGFSRKEELIYQPFGDFFVSHEIGKSFFKELNYTGAVRNYEAKLRKNSGEIVDVILSAKLDFDDRGNKSGFRGLLRDVTEVKLLEKKLMQMRKLESLGSLARVLAGEFTNILTTIMGFSSLLKISAQCDPVINEYIDSIQTSARIASRLVSQLMAFSRSLTILREPVDFRLIVSEIIEQIRHMHPRVHIMTDLPSFIPPIIGDRSQLKLVIKNLCDNAIEAMDGAGELRIKLNRVTINSNSSYIGDGKEIVKGDFLKCTISDNGRGMDSMVLERIFEPFFTTKHGVKGAGLGLSIVYGITKEHGGFLDISSTPGKGTEVELYLPIMERESSDLQRKTEKRLDVDHEK